MGITARSDFSVEVLAHTLPPHELGASIRPGKHAKLVGLLTVVVEVPYYLWVELLTHKRFARNAQSARASSTGRLSAMGYYIPDAWYGRDKGMRVGEELSSEDSELASRIWEDISLKGFNAANSLYNDFLICKEQANRLVPINAMRRGILTATQPAWRAMLELRSAASADTAMQKLASSIQFAIDSSKPERSYWHVPYRQGDISAHSLMLSAANIAAVSYTRDGMKDDPSLAERLLEDGHMSPFEHIARYRSYPVSSAICSRIDDVDTFNRGWESMRGWLDGGFTMSYTIERRPVRVKSKGAQECFLGFCDEKNGV